jgi:hypothetical protein
MTKNRNNILNHTDCITQMDMLYQKLENMEKDYKELYEEKQGIYKKLKEQREVNKDLQIQVDELKAIIEKNETQNKKIDLNDSKEFKDIIEDRNKYKEKHDEWNRTFTVLGFKGFDDLNNFISNNKNNNSYNIEDDDKFISLKMEKTNMQKQIDELNNRLSNLSNNNIEENINVDRFLEKQKKELFSQFDEYKKDQEIKYNTLNNDYIKLKKEISKKDFLPTPSSSTKNIDIDKILICSKCKKENKFLYSIGIYKGFCRNCKNIDLLELLIKDTIFYDKLDKTQKGYRTINNFTETLYYKILYNNNIYLDAEKDGIDTTNWNILIDYIKKYKEIDISKIKNKLIRSKSLMFLFNENKYKDIQDIIKGINFSSKILYTLDENQWLDYKIYLEKLLDNKLKEKMVKNKSTINDIVNKKNNRENTSNSEENEDDNFIKCLKCNSYIPDYINDGLCCYCGSDDKYWN